MRARIITALVLLTVSATGFTKELSGTFGVFNSPKGFGACLDIPYSEVSFNSFAAYADIYGVGLGRSLYPGGKLLWMHNHVFRTGEKGSVQCDWYVGAGISVGYVHDFERVSSSAGLNYLKRSMGFTGATAGNIGLRMDFGRRIMLDLGFCAELGGFLSNDNGAGWKLQLYRNGLVQTLHPQLKIVWKL